MLPLSGASVSHLYNAHGTALYPALSRFCPPPSAREEAGACLLEQPWLLGIGPPFYPLPRVPLWPLQPSSSPLLTSPIQFSQFLSSSQTCPEKVLPKSHLSEASTSQGQPAIWPTAPAQAVLPAAPSPSRCSLSAQLSATSRSSWYLMARAARPISRRGRSARFSLARA